MNEYVTGVCGMYSISNGMCYFTNPSLLSLGRVKLFVNF